MSSSRNTRFVMSEFPLVRERSMVMQHVLSFVLVVCIALGGVVLPFQSAFAQSLEITIAFTEPSNLPSDQIGYVEFRDIQKSFVYNGGSVCISLRSDSCASFQVDDGIKVWVNGQFVGDFQSRTQPVGPIMIPPELVVAGNNTIRVVLYDMQGPFRGTSPIYLVTGVSSTLDIGLLIGTVVDDNNIKVSGVKNEVFQPVLVTVFKDSNPVSNASVSITGNIQTSISGVTDQYGQFAYSIPLSLPPNEGEIKIVAHASNGIDLGISAVTRLHNVEIRYNEVAPISRDEAKSWSGKVLNYFLLDNFVPDPDAGNAGTIISYLIQAIGAALKTGTVLSQYSPVENDTVARIVYEYTFDTVPTPTKLYLYHTNVKRNGQMHILRSFWTDSQSDVLPLEVVDRKAIVMVLNSPATLYVSDANGQSAGIHPGTGQRIFDFPAALSQVGDEPYVLLVPGAKDGVYEIQVVGTGTGFYGFNLYDINDQGNKNVEFQTTGETNLGEIDTIRFAYDKVNGVTDITPPVTTASATGPFDSNGVFRDSVSINLTASDDLSGVAYSEYSLTGGASWIRGNTFSISGNGVTSFVYRSVDKYGNVEVVRDSGPIVINKYVVFAGKSGTGSLTMERNADTVITGSMHSNGDVRIVSNTKLKLVGTLYHVGNVTYSSNTSGVSVPRTPATPVTMLSYPMSFYQAHADHVMSGNVTINSSGQHLSGVYFINGNLTLKSAYLTGDVVFAVTGNITNQSTGSTLVSSDARNGILFYAGGSLYVKSAAEQVTGMYYAPNGAVIIDGATGLKLNGSIVAKTVTLNRTTWGTTIKYDAAFSSQTVPLPLSVPVASASSALSEESLSEEDTMQQHIYLPLVANN